MKSKFRGLIRHSATEFDELWKTAIFAFDANVLLNAYRLEKKSSAAFLNALTPLKGRAWLPHQAGMEFFRHRDTEIQKQFTDYQNIKTHLSRLSGDFRGQFQRHLHVPLEEIAAAFDKLADEWTKRLSELEKLHHNPTFDDPTLTVYLDVFEGMVGDKTHEDELKKWHKEADERYAKKIPPGFEDAKKKDGREYGDVVLWFQLLEYARKAKKPVIFVTDDAKDDWWQRISGKTLGPHPLLSQEMHEKAGILFHAYPMHRFVEESARRAGGEAGKEVIDNIKVVQAVSTAKGVLVGAPLAPESGLTDEAEILLLRAQAEDGIIRRHIYHTEDGIRTSDIEIHGRFMLPGGKHSLKWANAFHELVSAGLIKKHTESRTWINYLVTDEGRAVAERIMHPSNWPDIIP